MLSFASAKARAKSWLADPFVAIEQTAAAAHGEDVATVSVLGSFAGHAVSAQSVGGDLERSRDGRACGASGSGSLDLCGVAGFGDIGGIAKGGLVEGDVVDIGILNDWIGAAVESALVDEVAVCICAVVHNIADGECSEGRLPGRACGRGRCSGRRFGCGRGGGRR